MVKQKGKLFISGLDEQQASQMINKEKKKKQKSHLLQSIRQSAKNKQSNLKNNSEIENHKILQQNQFKNLKQNKQKKIKKKKKKIFQQKQLESFQEKEQKQCQQQNKKHQIDDEEEQERQQSQNENGKNLIKLKHLAIAIPDSILQIPQTSQLRAYFISQIARISSIFKVDEIIILKDHSYVSKSQNFNPSEYMARNLQYLQTPQYLRKHLFKLHADLKNAGLMNPIQCQHHLKTDQLCQFREGVALDRPTKKGSGSWVDIGLKQQARMNHLVLPLTRVTLRLQNFDDPDAPFYEAQAVSKRTPRIQQGLYWGYDVRIAKNMKDMMNASRSLSGSSQQTQYDIKVLVNHTKQTYNLPQIENFYQISQQLTDCSILIFFSGTDDLSTFIQKDSNSKISKDQAIQMFNCCMRLEGFGVKNLRIEEQLFITLSKVCDFT